MPTQDTSKIKENIIEFIHSKGPSLPVHISQAIGLNSLFTSAFLSELFSEKRLKMSTLRVGSSPIYFLPNQEQDLEKFSNHLKSKEKEAFLRIKENRVLIDSEQEPAIRVALRAIKDFAIPFERNGELYWRYFLFKEGEVVEEIKDPEKQERVNLEENKSEQIAPEIKPKKKIKTKLTKKTEKPKKSNDKFLFRVKEFLSKENIEIIDIESFSKERIVLKVKTLEGERAFIAYNKKKIEEKDLISANKKAEELGLKYLILSLGEPSKKMKEIIDAVKNLSGIEKIE
jgi:hypothetical protein